MLGLAPGKGQGICECGGLLLKMSRRVGGQGEARRRGKTQSLTFEPLAGFKKFKSMGVHVCEGLSQGEIRRIGGQGEGQPPPPPNAKF